MAQISFGNYEPDRASNGLDVTNYVRNALPTANGYGPLNSIASFTGALPDRCLGFISCVDSTTTVHIFAGTADKLYKLNLTTRVWADVSKVGSYTVAAREFWSFARFGDNIIAVTNGTAPQVYTLNSSALFADLGGSPPQARRVWVVGDFVALSGLTATPNRIQWSGLNDSTIWTPGTSSSGYQDFPDGGLTHGIGGGEFGLVFQETAIRRMIFNPASDTIFDFSRINKDRGIYMPYSLAESNASVFFYAQDGFYKIDATGALTPIGENRIDTTFLTDADLSDPRYMIGSADPASQHIFWSYKSKTNTSTSYNDKLLIYDWVENRWAAGEINLQYIGRCSPVSVTLESLDSIDDLDGLTVSLDSFITQSQEALAAFGTDSQLGFFQGTALEAAIDTPEGLIGDGQRMFVRDVATIGSASSFYVSIAKRERLQDVQSWSAESSMGTRGYAPQRVSGRYLTARVRIPAGTIWTYLRGVEVEGAKEGLR